MRVDIYLYGSAVVIVDIILRDPTVAVSRQGGAGRRGPDRYPSLVRTCPFHEPGVCRRVMGADGRYYCVPIIQAKSLWENLVDQYGNVEATHVYLGMRVARQGPFAPGNKYDPERPAGLEMRTRAAREGRRDPV